MKFGSLLRTTADCLPEITCLFDTYKQLKKQLKRLPSKSEVSAAEKTEQQQQALTHDEAQFVETIDRSLADLNNMFIEKEEEAVIRLEALQAASYVAVADDNRRSLYKQLVDFHGEVLLLVHWSVLAYTATVKILKKHHKRTGLLLRAPQLENLLSQPFCSTELMTQLAHKAEETVNELASALSSSTTSDATAPPRNHTETDIGDETMGDKTTNRQEPTSHHSNHHHGRAGSTSSIHTHMHQGEVQQITSGKAQPVPASLQQGPASVAVGAAAAPAVIHVQGGSVTTSVSGCSVDGTVSHESEEEWSGDEASLQAITGLVAVQKLWQENRTRLHKSASTGDDSAGADCNHVAVRGGHVPGSGQTSGTGSGTGLPPLAPRRAEPRPLDLLRRTQVALDTWSQLRATASTPSTVLPVFALPATPSHGNPAPCHHQHQHPEPVCSHDAEEAHGMMQGTTCQGEAFNAHMTTCNGGVVAAKGGLSGGKRSRGEFEPTGPGGEERKQALGPVALVAGAGNV